MAAFKLPRLKANLAIVNGQGKPLDYFLRFWNIEVAPRIEQQEANQDDLIAQIQAVQQEQADQLDLIIAAQARADQAYNLAQSAQGGRYIDYDGPYPTISGIINNQSANSQLSFSGSILDGTINANTAWVGTLSFYENNGGGGGDIILGSVPLTIASSGSSVGGNFATEPASFVFEGIGTLSGNVTYKVTATYVSGASIAAVPNIFVNLATTPRAS